jgi:FkbM family methyltransferase
MGFVTKANSQARAVYLALLGAAEGAGGKFEVAVALARAAVSRLSHGRGALHVRRPIVIAANGVRWWVPPFDNSFASTLPGNDTSDVVPEIRRLLGKRPQRVCLDIGANLGVVCMTLAREFADRAFVAVEPVPWLADSLERTARLNGFGNVTVIGKALADVPSLELVVPTVGGVRMTALSSGAPVASPQAAGMTPERHTVPGIRLDELLDGLGIAPAELACVKIDVEGLEARALATGGRALSAHPPVLYEALTPEIGRDVEAVLRGFGYRTFRALDHQNFVASA